MLQAGMAAPDFSLKDAGGKTYTLKDFSGEMLVLYFYPRDNTPGCARQAASYAELDDEFKARHARVIGISKDSAASHLRFAEKYQLPFTLLSDPERTAIEAYGVWQEKKSYGKVSMGVVRSSFIVDENGTLRGTYYNVKAGENPADMLRELDRLAQEK